MPGAKMRNAHEAKDVSLERESGRPGEQSAPSAVERLVLAVVMSDAVARAASVITATPLFFREHPAILVTAAYGFTSMLGLLYMRALFAGFDLNIIDFVDINWLFLGAFKRPAVFSGLISGATGWLAAELTTIPAKRWMRRKAIGLPEDLGQRYLAFVHTLRILAFVVALAGAALCSSWGHGSLDAKRILAGEAGTVVVELKSVVDSPTASKLDRVAVLGVTTSFAFFYDPAAQRTYVIPVANVQQMYVVRETEARPLATATAVPP
jgi:hypothetical protein